MVQLVVQLMFRPVVVQLMVQLKGQQMVQLQFQLIILADSSADI
jgi:hypothetical protein